MGIIGKTHGVRSDKAPPVFASQMNDQSEPPRLPAPGLKTTAPVAPCDPFTEVCGLISVTRNCCADVGASLPRAQLLLKALVLGVPLALHPRLLFYRLLRRAFLWRTKCSVRGATQSRS